MRKLTLTLAASVAASPALAASGPFFSLKNTDFVVLLGFLLFVGVLLYFKVFRTLGGMLDSRAQGIRNDLDEARKLREEAQSLLASYERKQREVQEQADRIVEHARAEAQLVADQARVDLEKSIARRLAAAEDQITSAQNKAVKDVRDRAIVVAVRAAQDVIARQMTAQDAASLIDKSIDDVGNKLH